MNSSADRRRVLDEAAELYDRFRPTYPDPLVNDVERLSGIPPRGTILEIGCGTGQATVPFAERGYRITCLEPGPNLARIAKQKLAGFANVRVEECTLEDFRAPDADVDLVIAAQSFHLVDPVAGLANAARLLRHGGALALFGNHPLRGDGAVHDRIQDAYARHAPELNRGDTGIPFEDVIDVSGLFGTVLMSRYRWRREYAAAEFVGLMNTHSPHRLLPPDQRSALLQALGDAILSSGGSITIDYVARLYLARRS